ncbi:MAG: M14 family zinc carboxypeptidase [Rhodothermales bacterium]
MTWDGIHIPAGFLEASEADGEVIGFSEEQRPIRARVLGSGPRRIFLMGGAHADEPVGPTTLRALVRADHSTPFFQSLFSEWTLCVVPHVNPDGEARNAGWRDAWPDPEAYMAGVRREPPGRDLEFGFPDMRPENEVVAAFMRKYAPFRVHASLHGMGFSEGALLLIEKNWAYRTEALQRAFIRAANTHGLGLHDHNRKGEKGFFRIAAGFTTTPEGEAMRRYFLSHDEPETAALFRMSSMEYVRSLGGDPLCAVTELPLFLVDGSAGQPERPEAYLAFRERLPAIRSGLANGRSVRSEWTPFGLPPVPVTSAVDIHLQTLAALIQTAT